MQGKGEFSMAKKISTTQERLNEMMKAFDIRPADIVRRTGINKSTLSNYINGKREARQDQLSLIADSYGVNPAWLLGYDVPMTTTDLGSGFAGTQFSVDPSIIDRALQYYQVIENLPPEKRASFENYLKFLLSDTERPG